MPSGAGTAIVHSLITMVGMEGDIIVRQFSTITIISRRCITTSGVPNLTGGNAGAMGVERILKSRRRSRRLYIDI